MVEKINANGGNAKLTILENNAHDVWTDAFTSYEHIIGF